MVVEEVEHLIQMQYLFEATYTPSMQKLQHGTVTLKLTTTGNGTCNAVPTDQMTITITPAPTVDAGTGEELCSNNPISH